MVALLLATAALQTIVWGSSLAFGQKSVEECFAASSIDKLAVCLDEFTVPSGYYTPTTYAVAQPTDDQRADWRKLIHSLLDTDGYCSPYIVPNSLQSFYTIKEFAGNCVLYEKSTVNGIYVKGWGTMVVPRLKSTVLRNVHFSPPHGGWENGTIEQAASLFHSTQSKSFLVSGREFNASTELSGCIIGNGNYKTDVSINTVR
jgi:hypothetical protein